MVARIIFSQPGSSSSETFTCLTCYWRMRLFPEFSGLPSHSGKHKIESKFNVAEHVLVFLVITLPRQKRVGHDMNGVRLEVKVQEYFRLVLT